MAQWLRILFATGAPDEVAPLASAHREQVRALARAGRLRMAGEIGRDSGFVEIFEARDRREAEELLASSPLVEAGLCTSILREMGTLFFSAEDATEKKSLS